MNVPADHHDHDEPGHDHHEPDHWRPRHPLRDARGGHAGAQLHGRIFVLGGFTSGFAAALDSVEVRDPNTDTWRRVAPMPTARGNPAAAAAGGRLYAIGGFLADKASTQVPAVEAYEPAANTWAKVAPLPIPRGGVAAAAVGKRLYVAGGGDHRVDVYDVDADSWHTAAPMPTARNLLKLIELAGQVYAIGGKDDIGHDISTVERYDPHHDRWDAVAPMGSPQGANPGVVTVGGRIVVVGGGTDISAVYDPHADKWHPVAARLPTERASLVAARDHDDVILAIGGFRPRPSGDPLALDRVDALRITHP
jgi:N-acetylneuraminic acid mutarotase